MKYLYLDTSTSYLYAGVVSDDKLIFEIKDKLENNLSTISLALIEKKFKEYSIDIKEINKIIVVNGPGSFTGVRIGVTIAKTWAWAMKIDITEISSLLAMAISCNKDCYKIPIIDARRDCYYAGIYDPSNKIIMGDSYITKDDLMKKLKSLDSYVFVGKEGLEENIEEYDPDILKIVNFTKNFESINPHAVNPNYLKLTQAEENLK